MNKSDLIDHIARQADITKAQAKKAVESYHDAVASELKAGNKVDITGFGSFSATVRAERTGRNPRTGETLTIKASKVPKFKPGKGLRDAL
jgi:DNA-binding protein HU-beta